MGVDGRVQSAVSHPRAPMSSIISSLNTSSLPATFVPFAKPFPDLEMP